jgi:hypothetical protein
MKFGRSAVLSPLGELGAQKRIESRDLPRYLKSLLGLSPFRPGASGTTPRRKSSASAMPRISPTNSRAIAGTSSPATGTGGVFSTRLSPQRAAMPEFDTTAQGCRLATSVGGVLTGRGADLIIIDDPLKPEEALSQAQRQSANEWYDHTLYSRLKNKLEGAIVLIMHQLHEDDLTGHVLAQEAWEVVRFPAIAEDHETQLLDTVLGPQNFARRTGTNARRRGAGLSASSMTYAEVQAVSPRLNRVFGEPEVNHERPRIQSGAETLIAQKPDSPAAFFLNRSREDFGSTSPGFPEYLLMRQKSKSRLG